jgi:hypothetical protein
MAAGTAADTAAHIPDQVYGNVKFAGAFGTNDFHAVPIIVGEYDGGQS